MDGAYLLELLKGRSPAESRCESCLTNAGGCSTGVKVANINHEGDVHPCHFMPQVVVGNVRERSFRDIWIDHPSPELLALRDIKSSLKGACGKCEYLDLCGGCRQKALLLSWRSAGRGPDLHSGARGSRNKITGCSGNRMIRSFIFCIDFF